MITLRKYNNIYNNISWPYKLIVKLMEYGLYKKPNAPHEKTNRCKSLKILRRKVIMSFILSEKTLRNMQNAMYNICFMASQRISKPHSG